MVPGFSKFKSKNRSAPRINRCYVDSMSKATDTAKLAAATENDARWTSVVARDPSADGEFYYSVASTGVYCRPTCAARLARPENVRFHRTREEAEKAGF